MTTRPFDDIKALISAMPGPDAAARRAVLAEVGARGEGLGRLAELAGWLASWRGRAIQVRRPLVALYIGAQASAPGDPSAAAQARLEHLAAGGEVVSLMARSLGAGVEVFDLASARPSPDPAHRAAMSERECAATMAFGMEALAKEPDVLVLADATAGAETAAEALLAALAGETPAREDVAPILARVQAEGTSEPLDLLRQTGGRASAAILGGLVAAGTQRTPVLIDGAAAIAAAAVLHAIRPDALGHVRLGHAPPQSWAGRAADRLGLTPVLALEIDAGEGTGAVAALSLVKLAGDLGGG